MYKFLRIAIILLGLVLFLVPIVYISYTRISNIDMTEARLLVTYWKEYLLSVFPMSMGAYLLDKGINRM